MLGVRGRVPERCGSLIETSPNPSALCASDGHQPSHQVFRASFCSLCLLAGRPHQLSLTIIRLAKCFPYRGLWPREHLIHQYLSAYPPQSATMWVKPHDVGPMITLLPSQGDVCAPANMQAWIMASATLATSGRGTHPAVPQDSLVHTASY